MTNFRVGDYVECKVGVGDKFLVNQRGYIKSISSSFSGEFLVEFDNEIKGHDGLHLGVHRLDLKCWNVDNYNLIIVKKEIKVYGIVTFLNSIDKK